MIKKLIRVTLILTSLLVVLFVVQPKMAQVSAATGDLLIFDQIAPHGEIFRGDIVLFGGTIYNNDSQRTFILMELAVDILDSDNISRWLDNPAPIQPFTFYDLEYRNTLEPFESRTFVFEKEIDKNVPIGENQTMRLRLIFKDIQYIDDENVRPYEKIIGDNITELTISVRPYEAPNYIYVVFVLLLLGIISFIVIGLVGWIRARRNK